MKKLIAKIRAIIRNRRVRKIWTRTVSSIACLVVFITTYALVLPAITMESEASCGIEAHQHNESCYEDESCYEERLTCNIPESDGHMHTEDCYSTTQKLICALSEHLHTSDCYDEEGNLICSQEEHQHGKECYEEIRELICGLEESEGHHHDSSCYEKVLTCEKEVHTHSPACYREDAASVATTEHAAVAVTTTTSADDVAIDETANASGTFDPAETAAEGYVPTLDELDFRQLLNDYTTIYYHRPEDGIEDSGQITDWKKVDEDTVLEESDILRVYLAYTIPAGSLNETNATARYRLPGNLHLTDEQMAAINQMENGLSGLYVDYDTLQITDTEKHSAYLGAEAVDGLRTPDQKMENSLSSNNEAGDGDQTAQEIISAVVKTDQIYDEDGVYGKKGAYLGTDLVFTFSPYTILKNRNEYDSDGTPVKAGESVSGWFTLDFNMDQVDWKDNAAEITFVSEDIDLNTSLISESLQKADPISEESPDSNNPDDEKAFNENSSTEENKDEAVEETHPAVSFEDSLTVHTGNLSSDTEAGNLPNSSKMTVSVSAEAGTFPAGTAMVLSAVTDMDALAEAVEGTVDSKTCGFQAVDISFRDKDGNEIEPLKPISVTMRSDSIKAATEDSSMAPVVVHVEDQSKKPADATDELVTTVMETLPSSVDNNNSEPHGITDSSESISFKADSFSIYAIVYTVDFSYEINGKVYGFTMQGADSVSLRALIDALHVYEFAAEEKTDVSDFEFQVEAEVTNDDLAEQDDSGNADLDSFMGDIKNVTFSNDQLLVPAKVEEDTTVGKIKTDLNLFPTYPLGLKQSEVLELNAKEYTAGDWVLISMKAFDTMETLTITMNTGESFNILVTDAQDAVMNGDVVQTISNPAGTTIDLFDYWIVSQDLVGRDGWGDLNQGQGAAEAGDNKPLNGTGNNKGINSSTTDTEHGHALKFNPAWSGTVYNGNKIGTTGNAWQSVNLDMRDGLNSYTGDEYTWHYNCPKPFTGIVQNNLSNGYPILTNNQDIGTNGESLAYLFDPSVAHEGKASYDSVNQLLYVDKDGYYTYDSRDYAASFDTENKTFTLTEQTSTNSEVRGFWPFGTQNFWTGMHVNTQFSMPAGGQVLNPSGVLKPMQFEFSGDDDVWIYVDGILIGDAGGIHNRTEVDINFQTGIVSISLQEDKYLDDLFRTGLRDQGKTESEIEEYIANNFDGHTFKVNSYHSFDFFYLERGGGESNLYIHYNLVSTADFTAHKSYYGADKKDILTRDQFKFELIGLDGKYRLNGNNELVQEDATSDAVMPHASGSGEGTVASPHYEDNVTTTLSSGTVNSQIYITGVSEDGNVNFGTSIISQTDMNEADQGNPPVYKYIIREIVPDDAVNQDGIIWAEATDVQKAAGGFVKDQVTYDGTVYYMTGQITSWTETNASGQEVTRHGIAKTYYTDDTYTMVKSDVSFVNFENRFTPDFGSVDFEKVDGAAHPLPGAVFALYSDEACKVPLLNLDAEGHPVWTATSGEDGKVSFENVRIGTYYMKETEAPSEYALDETVYKVVIEDSKDKTRKSKITILGDEEETPVTEIANAKSGKITVIKKWLNASGTEVDGGSNSATVWLKRKHMVAEEGESTVNHTVTVQMTVEDGGVKEGTPVTRTVTGDTVVIEWDDEYGQGDFNWWLTIGNRSYDGWINGTEEASGDGYIIHQEGENRRLTITNIRNNEDISFKTKYWKPSWLHSDPNHWNNLNNPSISGIAAEPNFVAAEDTAFNSEKHTQILSGSSWSHTWNIGGTESSHSGFDYPAMDDNDKNYLYYVVELDAQGNAIEVGGSPLEGYVLQGYSANNNTGISNQGMITVYNRAEGADTINVVIKKTDNAQNSTNYLNGAVFKLMYRSDSSGTFTNVSNESVPELDSNSQFTVPTAGITLTGLVDGQYQLQEISPPSGYVITNSTPVTFTVSGGAIIGTEGTITGVRYTAATETSDAEFIVPNEPGAALPNTGGPGTRLFTILGSILILGAGVMLWRRERFY